MTVYRIKLTKIRSLLDGEHPNGIETGFVKESLVTKRFFKPPKVGTNFFMGYFFITSPVKEIIDENTFRTENSIYKWEILEEIEP